MGAQSNIEEKMKVGAWRKPMRVLFCINSFVIIVQLILAAANGNFHSTELTRALAVSLVYANVTAIPAMLILPGLLSRIGQRKSLLFPAMIMGPLFFILAGCLATQILLWAGGILPSQSFWTWYRRTLPPVLLGSVLFGAGAFFYESVQQKLHEKEVMEERALKLAAEARLSSLESRIHPHFLFNTLNSISSLIVEDPALAERTVGRLAAFLRSSLDNANLRLVPLRQELAIIRDYFEIERVRFGDKLRCRIEAPEELQEAGVPLMSIQSLVENALKHGLTQQRNAGEFIVSASTQTQDKSLIIEVRDTGAGFNLADIPAGHGLDNLSGRLNALYGDAAYLKVFQRDGWCVVQMVLPL
jgi:two-component system, LytTR family, sensor histidine kinase AlgZ